MSNRELHRVCVFCGSRSGEGDKYEPQARALGTALAHSGIALVYGGASVGLMGAMADAALLAGGEVIGVLPRALMLKEVAHAGLSKLHIVGSMHERKALMAELSDGFIALPGGFGTLDELFEILTWAQLGIHHKPIALVNWRDFFTPLLTYIAHTVREGFVSEENLRLLLTCDEAVEAIELLRGYGTKGPTEPLPLI